MLYRPKTAFLLNSLGGPPKPPFYEEQTQERGSIFPRALQQ